MPILQDELIEPDTPRPANYPNAEQPDEFSIRPFEAGFQARRQAYLDFVSRNPSPLGPNAPWYELIRLSAGKPVHGGVITTSLNYLAQRLDCADFTLHALLRLIYQFQDSATSLVDLPRINQAILDFKYWPDEPGQDSMCTWTESHYILFAAGGYLAGQYFPDQVFANSGLTGNQLVALNRPRILRWMELRYFTGFSEWLSNVHYDADLAALVNLVDFCNDEQIQRRAVILIDLILLDMALNNFRGVFGSTHGRSYANTQKWAAHENMSSTQKLLFGCGIFSAAENMSAVAFALSEKYQLPRVIYEIANDQQRPEMLNRQRMSFEVAQARWWGLNPRKTEDALHLLTLEAYLHPKFARHFIRLMDSFDWWKNDFFSPLDKQRGLLKLLKATALLPFVTNHYQKDLTRHARETVNIYTYRTPDYLLSSAQDYRPGFGGDQQHLWQATLAPNAICFTTQPARLSGPSPNYWCGNGSNPRIAQYKNILIAIYHTRRFPALEVTNQITFSHAWLPRDQFEEFHEQDGWMFARWGDGYLALLSQYPYEWQNHPGEDQGREVIVNRSSNIWLCEMGDKPNYGDFQAFIESMLQAEVRFYGDQKVFFNSPSQGKIAFGLTTPLQLNGKKIPLDNYPRYGNPYTQTPFPAEQITLSLAEETLLLDWANAQRTPSNFI